MVLKTQNMAQVYKRNLKVMMIKIIFIITLLISYYAEATSSMNGLQKFSGDMESKVSCSQSDSMSYQCELKLGSNYYNTIHIKDNNECGEFSIVPISKDKISIECGFDGISNIYTYKLIDDNLLLDKYEYYYLGSGPSEVDEFIIDNLVSFRRNISTDISDNGNRMFSLGYVNKKSYLYNENYNKTDMYLVKGDKVLILDVKKDSKNNKWYKILFPGKKGIIKWMRSYNISYLSVNSEFLTR